MGFSRSNGKLEMQAKFWDTKRKSDSTIENQGPKVSIRFELGSDRGHVPT